jgi:hypothetical protein
MGAPLLEQLYQDLRAAEMFREGPRLSVPESQYSAMIGESWKEDGKHYKLVDNRDALPASSSEATLVDRCLGTFRLEAGGLAYFVLQRPIRGEGTEAFTVDTRP